MTDAFRRLSFVVNHPLNRDRKLAALARFARWQIRSRLTSGAIAVPFVDSTRLLVKRGMTGATGNVYCGLHEYKDMALVLHALRPGDCFVDAGANVGSYTVLAAGAAGASVVAFEPHPRTFSHLLDNVRLNDLGSKVTAMNVALGAAPGSLRFTADLDTENRVVADNDELASTITVPVERLDAALGGRNPIILKIDVEGFESEVLDGATSTMNNSSVLAVVMELNGSGHRYGYGDDTLHARMLGWGFVPCDYAPEKRLIRPLETRDTGEGNTLYVRNIYALRERVVSAPLHTVLGRPIY